MAVYHRCWLRKICRTGFMALLAGCSLGVCSALRAQVGVVVNPNQINNVGGIAINAEGLINNAALDAQGRLNHLRDVPAELLKNAALRKVSLRGLQLALQECMKNGHSAPEELLFLGGLQQIRYVLLYPEQKDIVLVGPGEGWRNDRRGNIVGTVSGRPVMMLDDLLVALRTARQAAQGGITCSIDPTAEGLRQLRTYVSHQHTIGDPATTSANIEQALGRQKITFTGVPATTHFAQVLIASDYRMKRLAMNFEPSPIRELPSFLSMISAGPAGMNNMLPRWWLEPKYEGLFRDSDGLAWEFRGGSVKALTEEDFLNAAGTREHTGKANEAAQRWADKMTAKYAELAVAEPIFGQLRNCMELAVVGALLVKEDLPAKAGLDLSVLLDAQSLKTPEFPAPRQVDSKVSLLRKGHNWLISASGGVAINSWGIIQHIEQSQAPAAMRAKAVPPATAGWCWN